MTSKTLLIKPLVRRILALAILSFLSLSAISAPAHGDVRETGGKLQAWHTDVTAWITPDEFFANEIKRLKGPTYGTAGQYPAYDTVSEWDTLIDRLPDGRECPMVFYHARWRRLPDVLALDERLRNYGGCKDVFQF